MCTPIIKFSDVDPRFADVEFPHFHPIAAMVVLLSDPSLSGNNSQHLDLSQSAVNELSSSLFIRLMQAKVNERNKGASLIAALCFFIDKVRARQVMLVDRCLSTA